MLAGKEAPSGAGRRARRSDARTRVGGGRKPPSGPPRNRLGAFACGQLHAKGAGSAMSCTMSAH